MQSRSVFSILLIFLSAACVDRISFDIGEPVSNVVIEGYISDRPGPYYVRISKAFDIESKLELKKFLSAKQISIFDDLGNKEVLSGTDGLYQTSANGIRGMVGRVYTLRAELLDGRIYESIPDTLLAGGSVDSIYPSLKETKDANGISEYGFDVFFNSTAGPNDLFLWKFKGTYQIETTPQLHRKPCAPPPDDGCPDPLPCSGYILDSEALKSGGDLCRCCTCWVDIHNQSPILNDSRLVQNGKFTAMEAGSIPIDQFTFMYKMNVEISQYSLTQHSYNFWEAVKTQQNALGSLFQPISGRIPVNFKQLEGKESVAYGIFYAAQINSNSIYIKRSDIPDQRIIPQSVPFNFPDKKENSSCLDFPFSTNIKPSFWVD